METSTLTVSDWLFLPERLTGCTLRGNPSLHRFIAPHSIHLFVCQHLDHYHIQRPQTSAPSLEEPSIFLANWKQRNTSSSWLLFLTTKTKLLVFIFTCSEEHVTWHLNKTLEWSETVDLECYHTLCPCWSWILFSCLQMMVTALNHAFPIFWHGANSLMSHQKKTQKWWLLNKKHRDPTRGILTKSWWLIFLDVSLLQIHGSSSGVPSTPLLVTPTASGGVKSWSHGATRYVRNQLALHNDRQFWHILRICAFIISFTWRIDGAVHPWCAGT